MTSPLNSAGTSAEQPGSGSGHWKSVSGRAGAGWLAGTEAAGVDGAGGAAGGTGCAAVGVAAATGLACAG